MNSSSRKIHELKNIYTCMSCFSWVSRLCPSSCITIILRSGLGSVSVSNCLVSVSSSLSTALSPVTWQDKRAVRRSRNSETQPRPLGGGGADPLHREIQYSHSVQYGNNIYHKRKKFAFWQIGCFWVKITKVKSVNFLEFVFETILWNPSNTYNYFSNL